MINISEKKRKNGENKKEKNFGLRTIERTIDRDGLCITWIKLIGSWV